MSLTKRFIEEQMELGIDLLTPEVDIDMDYKRYTEEEELKSEVFQMEIEEKFNELKKDE
jgi:hypothetical protein